MLGDAVGRRLRAAARGLLARVRPVRPLPHGVNVVGYLDATSGLGERARELVATLRAGGVGVSEWSVPGHDPATAVNDASPIVYDTTIAMVTAVQLADVRLNGSETAQHPVASCHFGRQ